MERTVERTGVRSFRTVTIEEIEGEEQAVVAIGERTGVQQLDMNHSALFDIEQVHTVRVTFKIHTGKEGVRLNV